MAAKILLGLFCFTFFILNCHALQCWHCSSELDPSCRDPFNNYQSYGGSSSYGSGSSYNDRSTYDGGYNDRSDYDRGRQYDRQQYGRQYDNQQYDPYNQNNNRNYQRPAQQFSGRQSAQLVSCNDYDANLKRMKNVCYKRKQTSANGFTAVIRRCEMVPLDTTIGTCYDPVARGITVDFCEYCDYDGCNSAHSLKIPFISTILPLTIVLWAILYKN